MFSLETRERRGVSTNEDLLRRLDERFILGEVSAHDYSEMKARLLATVTPPPALPVVADSVVKGNVMSATGSSSVGSINVHVGPANADPGACRVEYERFVLLVLRSGGSMDDVRSDLEDRRLRLGLTLGEAREIETGCSLVDLRPPTTSGSVHSDDAKGESLKKDGAGEAEEEDECDSGEDDAAYALVGRIKGDIPD